MADAEQRPNVAIGISLGLSVLIGMLWVLLLATLSDLGRSDAAGNALAQAYTAILIMALWLLLVVLAIIAAVKGEASTWSLVAALILIPAAFAATLVALDLLGRNSAPPYRWPLITPALAPPLIVAFCLWALIRSLRGRLPRATPALIWSVVALACLAVWPLVQVRLNVVDQFMQQRENYARDFAAMRPDAPLWEWTPFLDTPDQTRVATTLEHIKHLDKRQSEAETMLERGDFPLRYLGSFDLTPDASICEKARALLRKRVAELTPKTANSQPYRQIAEPVSDAVAAMSWLVGYDCSCDAEASAWEAAANAYVNPNFDVVRLRELRDPAELGRIVRRDPERFSMLSDKSHLKAWLKFADEKEHRDAALAGARKLDHRTTDAIEMLRDKYDIAAPWRVLRYIPALDLDPTPNFCGAALAEIRMELSKIHRPTPDDPRSYNELLSRLGNDAAQLPALQWLASHKCDAGAALNEAESLISAYQDSPQRAAMLTALAAARRN